MRGFSGDQSFLPSIDSGQARLKELGYKQELKRDLSVFSNFAISFSIISMLTGITTTYNTGLRFGGTVTLVYGWFMAEAFTMCVGLSMAEICSSYPTSGGLYYWSAMLASPRWALLASWMTGWYSSLSIQSINWKLLLVTKVLKKTFGSFHFYTKIHRFSRLLLVTKTFGSFHFCINGYSKVALCYRSIMFFLTNS